ncbi:MAG: histidine kinase [Clostridiales bacterium]|jgi:two-component system sensor histidine kinase YesM|nr:histidine kinase [Clostridiales bacterium]
MNQQTLSQTEGEIKAFYDSLQRLSVTTMYSPTTYDFIKQPLLDRILSLEDLKQVFMNAMSNENNIIGIQLYDHRLKKIADIGEELPESPFKDELTREIVYSSVTKRSDSIYYDVYFPIFDVKGDSVSKQIGQCVFMMKTDNLGNMLADALATENAEVYIIDSTDSIVASNSAVNRENLSSEMLEKTEDFLITSIELPMNGWRLISRLPIADLSDGAAEVRDFIRVSYFIAFVLIVSIIVFSYSHIVLPLNRIALFIRRIVKEPNCRLTEERTDEIGTVIANLNDMLDDKERTSEKLQESQKRIYEEEATNARLQILALRNQINPHFLYNTFECMCSMAHFYEVDGIAEITMALAKLLRYGVKGGNIVTIQEEIDYMSEYASIINQRFMGKIKIKVNAEDNVQTIHTIKLLLQPLVENAVFHGLEPKNGSGEVQIEVRRSDLSKVILIVKDNGVGMDEWQVLQIKTMLEKKDQDQGIGIANIYQRLKFFYHDHFSFDIKSEKDKGTTITIIIPDVITEDAQMQGMGSA